MEKIAVKQLTAQIEGKTILQDISFEVEAGQSLVIIGESGSGKTLLTKILIGQLPSSLSMQGEVHYGSMSLERNSLRTGSSCGGGKWPICHKIRWLCSIPFRPFKAIFGKPCAAIARFQKALV